MLKSLRHEIHINVCNSRLPRRMAAWCDPNTEVENAVGESLTKPLLAALYYGLDSSLTVELQDGLQLEDK